MDAAISIGGQSLIDGLLRILGPALESLRAPIPITLPGVTNALLSIRAIRAVQPSSQPRDVELELELDLKGEVLFVATVASNALNLSGALKLDAKKDAGTIVEPERTAPLANLAGVLTGNVTIPAADIPIDLKEIVGSLAIPPAGVTAPRLPFPGVVPVPVNFTSGGQLRATLFLAPAVNGVAALSTPAPVSATTGNGLDFNFGTPPAPTITLPPNYATSLANALTSALSAITNQLSLTIPGLTQPTFNTADTSTALAGVIPGALSTALIAAFSGLRARTGRLTYPLPAAGSSCDVRALPTVASAQFIPSTADGSLILQIGVDRTSIPAGDTWPSFTPTAVVDTGVAITNTFLRDLLVCLIDKIPHIALPAGAPTLTGTGTANPGAMWTGGVTVAVGPIALTGTLALTITGTPGAPGPAVAKTITLTFMLLNFLGAPLVVGSALDVGVTVAIPIAFDLSKLASVTALRDAGVPLPAVIFGIGPGLNAILITFAILVGVSPFVGPIPVSWLGFAALAFLIGALPHIVVAVIRGLLTNAVNLLLSGLRLLQSPAALPPGIFEAFGELIPTTLVVDDVVAAGVLQTPTAPWALRPILSRGTRTTVPPPGGGRSGGGTGIIPVPVEPPGASTTTEPRERDTRRQQTD